MKETFILKSIQIKGLLEKNESLRCCSTVLDEMGFLPDNHKHFGFGVSLFEDKNKFNYNDHYDLVMNKRYIECFLYAKIIKIFTNTKYFY